MANKVYLSIIFILFLNALNINAQEHVLYNMRRLPQCIDENPAFQPLSQFYFNAPIISNIKLSVNNSGFSYWTFRENQKLIDVADALWDYNSLRIEFGTDLIRFGGRYFDHFYSFNISFKSRTYFSYNDDFVNFLVNGNINDYKVSYVYDFSKVRLSSFNYAEIGINLSKRLDDKYAYGAKIKLLKGFVFADINLDGSYSKVLSSNQVPVQGNDINLKISGKISGLDKKYEIIKTTPTDTNKLIDFSFKHDTKLTKNHISDLLTKGNYGLAIDLGFTYKYTDYIEISASIIDLGFIYWDNLSQTIDLSASILDFKGIEYSPNESISNFNFNSLINKYLKDVETLTTVTPFLSFLPTQINTAVEYQYNDFFQYGSLFKLMFFNGSMQPQLSFYTCNTFWSYISTSLTYTIKNHRANNLGVGLDFKMGSIQLYAMTDNVLAAIWPHKMRSVGIQFGINFIFGTYANSIEEKIKDFNYKRYGSLYKGQKQ